MGSVRAEGSRTIAAMDGKRDNATIVRFAVAAALAAACLAIRFVAGRFPELFFPAYRGFSKGLMGILSTVTGVAPVALWDFLVVVLTAVAFAALALRVRGGKRIVPWISAVALAVSVAVTLFVGGWALNHYAPPLSDELGLKTHESSAEQLAEATWYYLGQAAQLAPQVPRTGEGHLADQDFYELGAIAGAAYGPLEGRYDVFSDGSHAPVKALLLWGEPHLYLGYVGIFMPVTGESSVAYNCANADRPFTMCHEAAHRLGIASEEEANFAAFLACDASDDVRFRYSGYYNAFSYCYSALYRADPELAGQLLEDAMDGDNVLGVALVLTDSSDTRAHYDAYEGSLEDVGDAVNNTYLRGFGEEAGVQSYGIVVDYLIAWYEQDASQA